MRTATYQRGDVLFAEIQFSGSIGRKRRPAVVLSVGAFHRAGSKLIVAGLTGTVSPPFRLGDVLIQDWQSAGLAKPSAMKNLITTVDRNEIVRVLGRLTPADFANVEQGIAEVIGLRVAGP